MMVPARCSPKSRSTSVMGIRASRPMGIAAILPSLTHRRTVSGCNPRRLATSPDRSNLVFSVLITRIDYLKYVNLSTVVHPSSPELCFTAELRLIAPKHHTWLHDAPRLASIKYGQTGTQTSIIG